MVLPVVGLSTIAYVFFLFKLRYKWIQQQVAFLAVFLFGLTIIGELDILLPLFFLASLVPFITKIRTISMSTGMLGVYLGLYVVYGLINQDFSGTLVSFIAKTWQFLVFFIVWDADIELADDDYKKTIMLSLLIETILGIYLLINATTPGAAGLVRLVSNAQPITGNISTVVLPITVYYYLRNRANPSKTRVLLWVNIGMLIWIVLSGTRGYTLEYAATLVVIFYDYFTNSRVGGATQRTRIMTITALGIIGIVLIFVVPSVFEKLTSVLRLGSSVGIRTFENDATWDFFIHSPIHTELFGIGLGGKPSDYIEMQDALSRQFSIGMWNSKHYLYDSGALFHNLFANILVLLGVLGIAVVLWALFIIWKRITNTCYQDGIARKSYHLFLLSFILMNYYRWSAVCGISEMIILALILKKIKQDNSQHCD